MERATSPDRSPSSDLAVQALRRHLAALYRADEAVSRATDLESLLRALVQVAAEALEADKGVILVWDEEARRLVYRAAVGFQPETLSRWLPSSGERSEGTVVVDDALADPRTDAALAEGGVRSFVNVPLQIEGGLCGIFNVSYGQPYRCRAEDVRLLEAIALRAAGVIARARLLERLRTQEAQYRQLMENANDLIFAVDVEGRFTFVNRRIETITGYKPEEVLGRSIESLVTPSSYAVVREHLQRGLGDPSYRPAYQLEVLRKDGTLAYVEVSSAALVENGRVVGRHGIARDVTERVRLEQEIARRQAELRASRQRQTELRDLIALTTRAVEEERRRIARELHDDTAQAMIAVSRRLDALHDLIARSPEQAKAYLAETQDLLDQTLASLRRFSRDLRPAILDDLGLLPALEWLMSELHAETQGRVAARCEVLGEPRRLPPDVELGLFRIAQEAVRNVRKHSGATAATLTLQFGPAETYLEITDNGRGFQVSSTGASREIHLGLVGMEERAKLLGGTCTIQSVPGRGTTVSVSVPY